MSFSFASYWTPLRFKFEQKIQSRFSWIRINPNYLSWANLIFSFIAAIFIAFDHILLTLLFLVLALSSDYFDGIIARSTNQQTQYGKYLDSSIDRIGESIFFIGLYFSHLFPDICVMILLINALLTPFLHLQLLRFKAKYQPTLIEKPDRNFYFVASFLILAIFPSWNIQGYTVWILVVLNSIANIQLFERGKKQTQIFNFSVPTDPERSTLNDSNAYEVYGYAT